MCEGEGKGCGHGYLATAVRWTDPSGIVPHSGCAKQSAPTFLPLSQPNRTQTLNQTRADVTRRSLASYSLDPAETCTSLPDAYRRIYHGACGACWTHRKLPTLNGHRRDARGAYLQHTKVPRDTLFPGGDQNLDSSLPYYSTVPIVFQRLLYFNGYVNSTEGHPQHMDFKHSCREVLPDVIQARDSCTFLLSQPISFLRPLAETSIRLNCQRRAPRLPPSSGSDNLFSAFAPHSRASV